MKQWISILIVSGILLSGCTSTATLENNTPTRELFASSTPTVAAPTETLTLLTNTPVPSIQAITPVPTANLLQPTPEQTQSGANGLTHNNVYLDKVEVLLTGKNPAQPTIRLQGSLPTPCDKLQIEIGKPDSNNQIQVQVYSLSDPNQICAQVLVPFAQSAPIKNLGTGKYSVFVNGNHAGDIVVP